MKYSLFQYLNWANPKSSALTWEQDFFDRHASLINLQLNDYLDASSTFGLIKSDIVLGGLLNREKLNRRFSLYTEEDLHNEDIVTYFYNGLPYFEYEGEKIYIPTYGKLINEKYGKEPWAFKEFPYSDLTKSNSINLVDPFDVYGNAPFASTFTRLVKLETHDEDSNGYWHPEYRTLYIIDNQGFLVEMIPLCDEKLKHWTGVSLLSRLEILLQDYYANDQKVFLEHLLTLDLISSSLYSELKEIVDAGNKFRAKKNA